MSHGIQTIGCIGDGRFAEALVHSAVKKHPNIKGAMWTYNPDHADRARQEHTFRHFSNIPLPPSFHITNRPDLFRGENDIIFVATSAQNTRESLRAVFADCCPSSPIVSCAKGIEKDTGLRMSEVISDALDVDAENIAALSGPNYAKDIVVERPMETVLAGTRKTVDRVRGVLNFDFLKIQTTEDIVGTELCGAFKNVIAIVGGMLKKLYPDDSSRIEQLVQKGLVEMRKLVTAFGGDAKTVDSPAGTGDLELTVCTPGSRNEEFGEHLVTGEGDDSHTTVEGRNTLPGLLKLVEKKGIHLSIACLLQNILEANGNLSRTTLRQMVKVLE